VACIDGVNYLLGCDPELFIFDKENQEYVGAHGLVPGTKSEPHFFEDGSMVQVDGLAAEFGIAPAETEQEFVDKILSVKQRLQTIIGSRYELHSVPHVVFSEYQMSQQLPENLALGCEPDFNAWTMTANSAPEAPRLMRSGGGHIHIGLGVDLPIDSEDHFNHCALLVRQLDATVGLCSTMWDKDTVRRSIYGKPGAFRPKSYGLEYRTPSNAWVANEKLIRIVYKFTLKAIEALHKNDFRAQVESLVTGNILEGRSFRATKLYETWNPKSKPEGYCAF
jgi:hypothetical protein